MEEHKGGKPYAERKAHFIERAVALWGDANDYSDLQYTGGKEPCIITCRKHGPYRVGMAQNHILKDTRFRTGCPHCKIEALKAAGKEYKYLEGRLYPQRKTAREERKTEREKQKIERAEQRMKAEEEHRIELREYVSKAGYDTSMLTDRQISQRYASIKANETKAIRYAQSKEERERKAAEQKAQREADKERQRMEREAGWIEQAKEIHPEYDYSKAYFERRGKHLYIYNVICPVHGSFTTKKQVHIDMGCKCAKCAGYKNLLTPEQHLANYMRLAHESFGYNRFDYSAVNYKNKRTPVWIRCIEHDRWFKMRMEDHVRKSGGCPDCVQSRGECLIRHYLEDHHIGFLQQYKVYHDNMFCRREYLSVDFYVPSYNMFIEFNGKQHYEYVPHFHTKKWTLEDQQERDETLRLYCKKRNIRLLEIPYTEQENIDNILAENVKI